MTGGAAQAAAPIVARPTGPLRVRMLRDTVHGNPGERRVLRAGIVAMLHPATNLPVESEILGWAFPLEGDRRAWDAPTAEWAESVGCGVGAGDCAPYVETCELCCVRPAAWGASIGGGETVVCGACLDAVPDVGRADCVPIAQVLAALEALPHGPMQCPACLVKFHRLADAERCLRGHAGTTLAERAHAARIGGAS